MSADRTGAHPGSQPGARPQKPQKDRGPVLALDASTLRPGAALLGPDGETWGAWQQEEGLLGTAPLGKAVAELLSARGLRAADLLGVVVGTGPGSYTGTRSAIAFARGLVFATGCRLAGVPSVAAAARGVFRRNLAAQRVIVLVDARRDEVYRADYERVQQTRIARSATRLAEALVAAGLREVEPRASSPARSRARRGSKHLRDSRARSRSVRCGCGGEGTAAAGR